MLHARAPPTMVLPQPGSPITAAMSLPVILQSMIRILFRIKLSFIANIYSSCIFLFIETSVCAVIIIVKNQNLDPLYLRLAGVVGEADLALL
jgi:hypothetical protein